MHSGHRSARETFPASPSSNRPFASALVAGAFFCLLPVAAHAAPLNDSGIQFCGTYPSGNVPPPCEPDGQDVRYGADAAALAGVRYKVGGGSAGFDFTKIANDGSELPGTAALGSGPEDWACTRDNTTGRVWEVKVDDAAHLRHQDHTYTWYFNPSPDNIPGTEGNTTTCSNTLGGQPCNTSTYAAAVNAAQLCGFNNWRVPTVRELGNLVDHARSPRIDPDYFPNTPVSDFWSSSPVARDPNPPHNAWTVDFSNGFTRRDSLRSSGLRARLVSSGP